MSKLNLKSQSKLFIKMYTNTDVPLNYSEEIMGITNRNFARRLKNRQHGNYSNYSTSSISSDSSIENTTYNRFLLGTAIPNSTIRNELIGAIDKMKEKETEDRRNINKYSYIDKVISKLTIDKSGGTAKDLLPTLIEEEEDNEKPALPPISNKNQSTSISNSFEQQLFDHRVIELRRVARRSTHFQPMMNLMPTFESVKRAMDDKPINDYATNMQSSHKATFIAPSMNTNKFMNYKETRLNAINITKHNI